MPQSRCYEQKNTAILNNYEDGGIAIICAQKGKKLENPDERTSWNHGRAERASSSPACCRERGEYGQGYTVFECRLDGNEPIAQVVQVPPDTADNIASNKTCMILETKQSEFGPSSRVAAYPGECGPGSFCKRQGDAGPMSFALEAHDRPGGAVACAAKIADNSPFAFSQAVTTLETTKGPSCQDGPSSRLTYGPVSESVEGPVGSYKPPAFYIQCTTTPEGPVARVTQVPQGSPKNLGENGTRFETFVKHDGSCPTAIVTRCKEKEEAGGRRPCEFVETRICPSGPRATALTLPQGSSPISHFTHLGVRPGENGPSARISQYPADPQTTILNLREDKGMKTTRICPCESVSQPPRPRCPRQLPTTGRPTGNTNEFPSVLDRRNGLSPTSSELEGRVGLFKYSRSKEGKTGQPKVCPPYCCPPSLCGRPLSPGGGQPAPCPRQKSAGPGKVSGSSLLWPTSCPCPLQPCFKALEKHPLPGGSVFSQCPAPALPDIAPVQLGSNRLRDYKPRPKTTGGRTVSSPTKRSGRVDDKSSKSAKSPEDKEKKGKQTRNKKTGSRGKSGKVPTTSDDDKDKESQDVSSEVPGETYVQCPAFASKGNQSETVRVKPTYVKCPAYESKGNQSEIIREKPTYVKCPAYESKIDRALRTLDKPTYVQCPAYESKRKRSISRFDEPSVVTCPAFSSKKTSETSSTYVPREEELIRKYPEYFRPKTIETFIVCRAKRNGLQDECHLHIPETVLRMSYEQRRNRHARTLVSSCGRRRGLEDARYVVPHTRYCERSSKNRKNHHADAGKDHAGNLPLKGDKQDDKHKDKHEESKPHDSPETKKIKLHLKEVKSRELRAGVVYYDCDCHHRNGLQQDCPRGGCGGRQHCTTKPWPHCELSHYFKNKWGKYGQLLDLLPPSTYCGPKDAFLKAKMGKNNHEKVHENGDKIEKSQEDPSKCPGKSANHVETNHQPRGGKSSKKPKTAGNEKYCKSQDLVEQYVLIPIADTGNCYRGK